MKYRLLPPAPGRITVYNMPSIGMAVIRCGCGYRDLVKPFLHGRTKSVRCPGCDKTFPLSKRLREVVS